MTPPDDIRDIPNASDSEGPLPPGKPVPPMREIGPESEVRGGPEAPEDDDAIVTPSSGR
jgi:hypothetical protein